MEKKVSRKKFDYFCRRVEYWMKEFGEIDWSQNFLFEDIGDFDAQVRFNSQTRQATFVLDPHNDLQTQKWLNLYALHEVVHLVTSDLDVCAQQRYGLDEAHLAKVEEKLVCKIVHVILSR